MSSEFNYRSLLAASRYDLPQLDGLSEQFRGIDLLQASISESVLEHARRMDFAVSGLGEYARTVTGVGESLAASGLLSEWVAASQLLRDRCSIEATAMAATIPLSTEALGIHRPIMVSERDIGILGAIQGATDKISASLDPRVVSALGMFDSRVSTLLPSAAGLANLAGQVGLSECVLGSLSGQGAQLALESVTALSSIGAAISCNPYESQASIAVDSFLGDWSRVTSLPEVVTDRQTRLDFYRDLGFDKRTTILPEALFARSLSAAGIVRADLFEPTVVNDRSWGESNEADSDWEAQWVEEGFAILRRLEIQLRRWINRRMTDRFGSEWVKARLPGDLRKSWEEKRRRAEKTERELQPLIWYADFSDYIKVIERNDNWRDVFSPVFREKEDIQVSFKRLHPVRIATMHARDISKDDLLMLTVEATRILRAIGSIEN